MADARVIPVSCESGAYEVHIGAGLIESAGAMVADLGGVSSAFVVSDSNVAPLYLECALASLEGAGIKATSYVFDAGEQSKTVGTWASILSAMAQAGIDRSSVVIALGGGVTGDMAGFAAASFMRGIRLVQMPTSLLAMVDSSVGGKTAVDLPEGKNLVGAFHQPELVIADTDTLATLPDEVFRDACGEVVKHAVLASPELFGELEACPLTDRREDADDLARIIAENVRIKRDVVEHDEQEQGLRQTLNLGHSVGHAIEAASGYALGHGSCVSAGLCIVSRWAAAEGLLGADDCARIVSLVEAHGLPTSTALGADELLPYMLGDKKACAGLVNLIVPTGIGSVAIRACSEDELRRLVEKHAAV